MTTPAARDTLSTDFALMAQAAAATDARSTEVRGLLHTFIARMTAVPPTVWSGASAVVFRDVVDRWNSESMRLCAALDGIAETIRQTSGDALKVGEGSLYPALQRLLIDECVKAEWGVSENNRRARIYTITPAGRKHLQRERLEFDQTIAGILRVLEAR